MAVLKALGLLRQAPVPVSVPVPAPRLAFGAEDAATIRCRHCGGARLKLSYRRKDRSERNEVGEPRTTFILRCAGCEGFTTVCA